MTDQNNLPTDTETDVKEVSKTIHGNSGESLNTKTKGNNLDIFKFLKSLALILLVLILFFGIYFLFKNVYFDNGKLILGQRVAIVDGESIRKDEYDQRVYALNYFNNNISKKEGSNPKQAALDDLIKETLLTKELKKQGIEVTDQEARDRIQKMTVDPNWGGDWSKYENALETQYKTNLAQVMTTYRIQLLEEKIKSLRTKKHLYIIWLAKTKVPFAPQEEAEAAVINKPVLKKAEEILNRVRSGEDFGILAKEFSEHKVSAEKGGDIGFLELPAQLTDSDLYPASKPVLEAVESLNEDQSGIFEYWTGYMIAKVTDVEQGIGDRPFDEWYSDLRKNANISILINVK